MKRISLVLIAIALISTPALAEDGHHRKHAKHHAAHHGHHRNANHH